MNVWMRDRAAPFRDSPARSMSSGRQRASAAITGRRTLRRHLLHAFRVVERRDGEAGLDQVHAQRVELPGQLAPSRSVRSEKPGACSPSRSVVSKIVMRSVAMCTVVRQCGPFVKSIINEFVIRIAYSLVHRAWRSGGITGVSDRGGRAELFARRRQAASDPAGRQPGDPPPRRGGGGAAVRSLVEGRHADRSRDACCAITPSGCSGCPRKRRLRCASCAICSAGAC